ncbi:MAG: hypothetical protein ACFCVA_18430 [Gammaproteobacteria bacterium]
MKKGKAKDEMRSEYKREDLGEGVRGKYATEYTEAHNIVLLDPEVAKVFPSEEAVNEALKSLIKVAQASIGLTKGSSGRS